MGGVVEAEKTKAKDNNNVFTAAMLEVPSNKKYLDKSIIYFLRENYSIIPLLQFQWLQRKYSITATITFSEVPSPSYMIVSCLTQKQYIFTS